jgi:hypothetical protein
LKGTYPERIRNLIRNIRQRVGLGGRGLERTTLPQPPQAQMLLF